MHTLYSPAPCGAHRKYHAMNGIDLDNTSIDILHSPAPCGAHRDQRTRRHALRARSTRPVCETLRVLPRDSYTGRVDTGRAFTSSSQCTRAGREPGYQDECMRPCAYAPSVRHTARTLAPALQLPPALCGPPAERERPPFQYAIGDSWPWRSCVAAVWPAQRERPPTRRYDARRRAWRRRLHAVWLCACVSTV
jgi:hypothetical protein